MRADLRCNSYLEILLQPLRRSSASKRAPSTSMPELVPHPAYPAYPAREESVIGSVAVAGLRMLLSVLSMTSSCSKREQIIVRFSAISLAIGSVAVDGGRRQISPSSRSSPPPSSSAEQKRNHAGTHFMHHLPCNEMVRMYRILISGTVSLHCVPTLNPSRLIQFGLTLCLHTGPPRWTLMSLKPRPTITSSVCRSGKIQALYHLFHHITN
jgi:hypothetical protein